MANENLRELNLRLRFQEEFDKRYVQIKDITLLRGMVYGFASLVLTGFILGVIALVFKS